MHETEMQTVGSCTYAAYKLFKPRFVGNEMKYFFVSASFYAFWIALYWNTFNPNSKDSVQRKNVFVVSALYACFAFFPQKLKYLIALTGLLKISVMWMWIKQGSPVNEMMTIAFGDLGFGITFLTVLYQLNRQK